MSRILFIARFGHDLRYFKKIQEFAKQNAKNVIIDVMFNVPIFVFEVFSLFKFFNKDFINSVIEYDVKRKCAKYGKHKELIYRILFTLLAKMYYVKYYKILSNTKYDAICVWNGFSTAHMVAIEVAKLKDIKVYYFENGFLPSTTVCDRSGVNFNNSVPRYSDFYKNVTPSNSIKTSLVARESVVKIENAQSIILPQKYIFVPFQVLCDTQTLMQSPWIADMRHLYKVIKEVSEKINDKELKFIIKKHPSCHINYDDLEADAITSNNVIFANHNVTQNLVENSEMVITINSSVGVESLLYNKRVIALGNAFYAGYEFVHTANSADKLVQLINDMQFWTPDEHKIKQFLTYLQDIYLIKGSWKNPNEQHLSSIIERIR